MEQIRDKTVDIISQNSSTSVKRNMTRELMKMKKEVTDYRDFDCPLMVQTPPMEKNRLFFLTFRVILLL